MKSKKMLLLTIFSIASFGAISPEKVFISNDSRLSRMPAQEEIKKLNTISSSEINLLKLDLVQMEKDLEEKTQLFHQKADEVEHQADIKPEIEFNNLFEIIADKKLAIEKIKLKIKNSKIEDSTCKAELQGEKLKTEIADLLKDKELILKEIDGLKVENISLKTSNKKKTSSNTDEVPMLENSATLLWMTQMTTMFTTQMQMQMQMQEQMQNQMLSMISLLQNNLIDNANFYKKIPTLSESIDLNSKNIGVVYPQSADYYNQNPYSVMPSMIPQQDTQGYDFNQSYNIEPRKVQMAVQSFSF